MAVAAAGVVVLAIFFHDGGTSPEPTVALYLMDWEQGQYQQAAALTTGPPKAVADELSGAYTQLATTDLTLSMGHISQQGSTATASFRAVVDLSTTGVQWTYDGLLHLRENGQNWQVIWSPSDIYPRLQAGDRPALLLYPPERQPIEASSGQSLEYRSMTYRIGVDPKTLPGAQILPLATSLGVALNLPTNTSIQMAAQIEASPLDFQELVTLTSAQYEAAAARLRAIPGLVIKPKDQALFDSIAPAVVGQVESETAPMLRAQGISYRPGTTVGASGLQKAFQSQLIGRPGIELVIEKANRLGTPLNAKSLLAGQPGKPVRTTLSYGMQVAANAALQQGTGSSALVAVQAGTGKILAASQDNVAGMPVLDPLGGQYQPGQAFTMISAPAFFAAGLTPDSALACRTTSPVNGHPFANLPTLPADPGARFQRDFALGCSTALAGASQRMSTADLTTAATEFGIGAPWSLPNGNDYFAGTIGQPSGGVALAADAIGLGDVRVSPLSMALAAAVADTGHWSSPSLVPGLPDPKAAVKNVMSPQVLSQLQRLMRDEAAHGSGASADAGRDLYGQAGVAPFSVSHGKKLYISWYVGYDRGTAFAIAELVKSPSDSAAPVAGDFLRNSQAGS